MTSHKHELSTPIYSTQKDNGIQMTYSDDGFYAVVCMHVLREII